MHFADLYHSPGGTSRELSALGSFRLDIFVGIFPTQGLKSADRPMIPVYIAWILPLPYISPPSSSPSPSPSLDGAASGPPNGRNTAPVLLPNTRTFQNQRRYHPLRSSAKHEFSRARWVVIVGERLVGRCWEVGEGMVEGSN